MIMLSHMKNECFLGQSLSIFGSIFEGKLCKNKDKNKGMDYSLGNKNPAMLSAGKD